MSESLEGEVQLVAYLVAKPGKKQELIDAISAIVPAVREEPGCIAYTPHVSREHPDTVVMYEVWADQAALDAHAAGANFSGLAARFGKLLAEPLRIEPLQRFG